MNFAFSVTVNETPYDVYYFKKDGKPSTMAFCKNDNGDFVIGLFCVGNLSLEEVAIKLLK